MLLKRFWVNCGVKMKPFRLGSIGAFTMTMTKICLDLLKSKKLKAVEKMSHDIVLLIYTRLDKIVGRR
jgi:hypothetical protein